MKFHRELYVGESIRHIGRVKWRLRHRAGQLRVFVIALAGGSDQLEIIHCAFLQQNYYRLRPPLVVGIAGGYEEALTLVRKIVADIYDRTGDCEIKEYFMKDWNRQAADRAGH